MSYSALMANAGFLLSGTSSPGTNPPGTTGATTASTAAEDDNGGSAVGAIVQLGILLLIPVGMYFLMIRPQRRRMREQQSLQKELGIGDEIVTNSGIYGFITGFENDDRVWVEIDDDVQIRIARAAIQGKTDTSIQGKTDSSKPATESTDRTTSS